MLDASADKFGAFEETANDAGIQDQSRMLAEAGECAYLLLCWIRWMVAFVTGTWDSNCCPSASEKPLRTPK